MELPQKIANTRYIGLLHRVTPKKDIIDLNAKLLSVSIHNSKLVYIEVTEDACWNYEITATKNEWKVLGLGGTKFDSIINPTTNAIRDHSDSIAEICKKEFQRMLPIAMYEERFRIMAFTLFQNIKNIQANEAQIIAQAREKALGYEDTLYVILLALALHVLLPCL